MLGKIQDTLDRITDNQVKQCVIVFLVSLWFFGGLAFLGISIAYPMIAPANTQSYSQAAVQVVSEPVEPYVSPTQQEYNYPTVVFREIPYISTYGSEEYLSKMREQAREIANGATEIELDNPTLTNAEIYVHFLNMKQEDENISEKEGGGYVLHVNHEQAQRALREQQLARQALEGAGVVEGMQKSEAATLIADYIENICIYDESYTKREAIHVFEDHEALCAGYAFAFKMMCEMCCMNCEIVLGTTGNADKANDPDAVIHAWNKVWYDNEWWYIDTCWNSDLKFDLYPFSTELWSDHHEGLPKTSSDTANQEN